MNKVCRRLLNLPASTEPEIRDRCKPWAWETCQGMEKQAIDDDPREIGDGYLL